MTPMLGIAFVIAPGILFAGAAEAQTARAELKDADGKSVGERRGLIWIAAALTTDIDVS